MIILNKIKTLSVEEKLLVQAILSEYHKNVMSVGLVFNAWNLRALAPNNSQIISVKRITCKVPWQLTEDFT